MKSYKYIEENVLWSIAAYGYRYTEKITPKFLYFVKKYNIKVTMEVIKEFIIHHIHSFLIT